MDYTLTRSGATGRFVEDFLFATQSPTGKSTVKDFPWPPFQKPESLASLRCHFPPSMAAAD
jgi:hypothetical protein